MNRGIREEREEREERRKIFRPDREKRKISRKRPEKIYLIT
jgi:hypothetical protein